MMILRNGLSHQALSTYFEFHPTSLRVDVSGSLDWINLTVKCTLMFRTINYNELQIQKHIVKLILINCFIALRMQL